MRDLLDRLYRLKMALVCVGLVVTGGGLITLSNRLAEHPVGGWIELLPIKEFGGILVGAGLLSVWIDHLFRREQDEQDDLRLRSLLQEQAPAMRDAVLEAFAANEEDLKRVAMPETLDRIIENSLGLRLHDPQFASEVYADVRDQAVLAPERWHDASLAIDLAPLTMVRGSAAASAAGALELFSVTVRWEYTVVPKHPERRFLCLSDREEYAEVANERGATSAWFLKPGIGFNAGDREAFELVRFAVDGEERSIRRNARKDSQTYSAHVGTDAIKAGKPVTISYTYRTVTRRHGNLLFFEIEQPTRDLSVTFDHTGCGLATVSVLDLVPSVRPTRIERPSPDLLDQSIRADIAGWIFPRSGIAFVWSLENVHASRRRSA